MTITVYASKEMITCYLIRLFLQCHKLRRIRDVQDRFISIERNPILLSKANYVSV